MILYYLFAILSGVSLGTVGVLVKTLEHTNNAISIILFRILFGILLIYAVTRFTSSHKNKSVKKDYINYGITGLFFSLASTTMIFAYLLSSIQEAVIIIYLYPFFVFILAYFILNEKINTGKIVSAIIAFLGLIIMNPFDPNSINFYGNIFALMSAIFGALFIVWMRKESNSNYGLNATMWNFIFAAIILSPIAIIIGLDFNNLILLAVLGIISLGIAYSLLELSLKKLDADTASLILLFSEPTSAILMGYLFLGETIQFNVILGGIFILAGGLFLSMYKRIHLPKFK